MFASVFVLLYVAHMLSDYPLQTDKIADHKADRTVAGWAYNVLHAGTHAAVSAVALVVGVLVLDLELSPATIAAVVAWVGCSHGFIDRRWPIVWWMEHTGQREYVKVGGAATVDQAAHFGALLVAALVAAA
ncbi:DUF3307 domain-containing protein [Streptomyces sp. NPDC049879]|uniref:DUF3307 domain-containing protein n=1 Tax=Streptomyces sp. NPDC049879 TaxID=3365598 RepID=UPI003792DD9E